MLIYIGTALAVFTVVISSYFLLVKNSEIKRILLFATIGLFSATILLVGERITTIRLPILGEIVAEAHQGVTEINDLRDSAIKQNKAIDDILKDAEIRKVAIDELSNFLKIQQASVKQKFLEERIYSLKTQINDLEKTQAQERRAGGWSSTYSKRNIDIQLLQTELNDLFSQLNNAKTTNP